MKSKNCSERRRPRGAMGEAMREALTRAPSDLAHTMAERQRDAQAAPRTSPGYERHMADKGRRIAGAAVAIHAERKR